MKLILMLILQLSFVLVCGEASAAPFSLKKCADFLTSALAQTRQVLTTFRNVPSDPRLNVQKANLASFAKDELHIDRTNNLAFIARQATINLYAKRDPTFTVKICERDIQLFDRTLRSLTYPAGTVFFLKDDLIDHWISGHKVLKNAEVDFLYRRLGLTPGEALIFQGLINSRQRAFYVKEGFAPAPLLEDFSGI